ncbi:hypothetical protein AVEN_95295-1 [Araneus ventricosus]|uniref:ISXO2-like transposase domain-containing protein n=1 Tax=Araneus ventricosus TaxID=182803 RepID=A0A4Y2QYQ4_ARAVE|nr:hypothetical protein AVEN_124867-1 [Araneus ventricosus]GBO43127.1 hypothetical protein AVEN_95295-1 [Araneus ventricosus]
MSCRVKHRAFESQAGMFDLEFLYGLKKGSKKEVIAWCMSMDMIAKEYVCPTCGEKMVLTEIACSDGYAWVCRKFGVNEHHIKRTVRKGSWFSESKLTMPEVLILTYLWVKKTPNEWITDEMNVSEPTVVDWKSFCREVCVDMLVKDSKEKIGGVGMIVEIDESKFGKRKFNRGKRVDGKWVFGGVERGSKRSFFCVVEDRTAETLIEITKKNVEPGTTVLSDCWASYNGLTAEGYVHHTVNHSKNFKDPVTGAHTNGIEGTWNAIKTDFRKQGTRKVAGQFDTYLAEYMWRRSHRGASMKSLFPSFIRGVTELYPPHTQDTDE